MHPASLRHRHRPEGSVFRPVAAESSSYSCLPRHLPGVAAWVPGARFIPSIPSIPSLDTIPERDESLMACAYLEPDERLHPP